MATMTVTIPDAQVPRVTTAVCASGGYQATLPDGSPNPVTQVEFVRQQITGFLKHTVVVYEAKQSTLTNDISIITS